MYIVKAKYSGDTYVTVHGSWSSIDMAERIADAVYKTAPDASVSIEIENPIERARRLDREQGLGGNEDE